MGKIIDYFVDFCDSDYCKKSKINNKCSYPLYKKGNFSNLFDEKITGKINHFEIEISTEDKFHLTYSPNTQFQCKLWLNNNLFCDFTGIYNDSKQVINYTFVPTKDFINLLNDKTTTIKCELTIDNKNICPKTLLLLAFIE